MSDSEYVSILSWPCMAMSSLSISILFLVIRAGYTMGTSGRDKEKTPMSTYWSLCMGLVLLIVLWSVVKFVD